MLYIHKLWIKNSQASNSQAYPGEDVLELASPVTQRPDVDAHVVVLRGRRDGERVPVRFNSDKSR